MRVVTIRSLPFGSMRGRASSSPRMSASSSSETSTSRMCCPSPWPAWPAPGCASPCESGSPGSPSPWPTPPCCFSPKRKCGMSMVGTGMVMNSFPFLPIISPFWTYFLRLRLIRPRTMSRKRAWSCLIFSAISFAPIPAMVPPRGRSRLVLGVAAREDRGDEVQHVRRADLAVPVVLHEALLHHVDLLLRLAIDDRGDEVLQLDR